MKNEYTLPECLNCHKTATEMTRIGYLCSQCFAYLEESCDFCSDLAPEWRYPVVGRFFITQDSVNNGDWLACHMCHGLIEAGDWMAIVDRSLRQYADLDQEFRAAVKKQLVALHAKFRQHQTGGAIRIGSA